MVAAADSVKAGPAAFLTSTKLGSSCAAHPCSQLLRSQMRTNEPVCLEESWALPAYLFSVVQLMGTVVHLSNINKVAII